MPLAREATSPAPDDLRDCCRAAPRSPRCSPVGRVEHQLRALHDLVRQRVARRAPLKLARAPRRSRRSRRGGEPSLTVPRATRRLLLTTRPNLRPRPLSHDLPGAIRGGHRAVVRGIYGCASVRATLDRTRVPRSPRRIAGHQPAHDRRRAAGSLGERAGRLQLRAHRAGRNADALAVAAARPRRAAPRPGVGAQAWPSH